MNSRVVKVKVQSIPNNHVCFGLEILNSHLNVKHTNKIYAVIARRERELRTRIKRGVPGQKWFAMCIKWRLDSNLFKHKRYSLTC